MKKKVNIILLLLVLTLWGTVAWRSLKNFFYQPYEVKNTTLYQSININKIEKDTFKLEKLNRDPFLEKSIVIATPKIGYSSYTKPIANSKKGNLSSFYKPTTKKTEPSNMPVIKYVGYIRSSQQKEEMVLLKINENLKRCVVGKKHDDILIKKVYKDSVQIIYFKKSIMVKKQGTIP
jgi:hypothetical protein